MEKKYIIAYDCGTTALKAVLVDMQGNIVGVGKGNLELICPQAGWAEQNPHDMWEVVCKTTNKVMQNCGVDPCEIAAIVFAAPWKSIIPVDSAGQIVHNAIIWMDGRATRQAERLNREYGSFVGTGQEYWARLMWLKQERPDIWQNAHTIMGTNTYFKWRATDEIYTEPSDDFINSARAELERYYHDILKAGGLFEDVGKFPKCKSSTELVGRVTPVAAKQLGICEGIPVYGGFGDLVAITIGTGCCGVGQKHIYLGTSSWLVNVIKGAQDTTAHQRFVFDESWDGALYALQTGCLALDWAVEQFYCAEKKEIGDKIYGIVDAEVDKIPAGSDNLLATHWLNGELAPLAKNAKGVFLNLTPKHGRRHMIRAVMESICYTHRRNLEMLRQNTAECIDSIRVVGGGASSDVWMQMLADVLQIKVQVPKKPRYAGAMGSYYCAMVGLGKMEGYNCAHNEVEIQKEFAPNPANEEVYTKMYMVYKDLYPTLKGIFERLNGLY